MGNLGSVSLHFSAIFHSFLMFLLRQRIYTRLPDGSPCMKMVMYMAALQDSQPNRLYTRLPGVNRTETPK